MNTLRNHAEGCGTTVSDQTQVIDFACGTILRNQCGTCGTTGNKSLKNLAEPCGTSAEPHTPLKGEVSASAPNHPQPGLGQIDEALWSDPEAYYDGPVHDCAPDALAAFWQAALTNDRATLRTQWPRFKGKVPDALARDIVEGVGK